MPPNGLFYAEHFGQKVSDVRLGADEYFLLGDNTRNARDSRFFGPVPTDDIVGGVIRTEPRGGP